MTAGSYDRHSDCLYNKMETRYNDTQKHTYDYVRNYYIENELAKPDENGVIDMGVSSDGTWLSKDLKSHVGVGFVTDMLAGKVLDCEV